ncbi:MAG: hypothetical protein GY875_06810 [Gammaproteobacteria bacterium]|nr:hypothetical protein [Gammaproteobacteria bacterium]
MKPIVVKPVPDYHLPEHSSLCRIPCLGIVLACAVVALLSACDPGSSSSEGIDPGVVEIPIAFIKRPIARDDIGNELQADLRDPRLFSAGGDVYLRSSTAVSASVINLTRSVTGGSGDIRGLNASFDGTKLIFSLRQFDPDPDDDTVPDWNIYEYDSVSKSLRRIIPDDFIAAQGDDMMPSYLPDGRIVFTSNRQKQAGENLINEGKPRYKALTEEGSTLAMVLHVMNPNGTDIHQISFNLSHDLYPQVLSRLQGGKIIFSRWDNAVDNKGMHFYTVNPDGSDLEILYGLNSHYTGSLGAEIQFGHTREMRSGELMVITRPYSGTFGGGDIVVIDAERFTDNDKPVWSMAGLKGPAQTSATINDVNNGGSISVAGRYASAFPLWDGSNRILLSKSSCQLRLNGNIHPCVEPYLNDPAAREASPAYGIWLYDMDVDTEKPIVLAEQGMVITEAITAQDRDLPPIIFDKGPAELDSDQEDENVGVVNIKSVYDIADESFDGCYFGHCTDALGINSVQDFADPRNATADQRPARFVRFIKPVSFPDPEDPTLAVPPDLADEAFGPQRIRGMREIVGYAAVEPDGSVKTRVPANLPLALEVLDGEGRRIGPPHFNWFQVPPGDTLTCKGCHTHDSAAPIPEIHGRHDAGAASINRGLGGNLQFVATLIPGRATAYSGNPGQTMAEVRFDLAGETVPPGIEPQLSADLVYEDYWTDPGFRPPDAGYAYRYVDLDASMLSPTNGFCTAWGFNCRSTINYPQHIHALWQLDRGADLVTPEAPDNPPNNDPTNTPLKFTVGSNGVGDDTCIECHTSLAGTRLPYGQLDLTTDPAQDADEFFRAYRELLFTDTAQFFIVGVVVDNGAATEVRPSMTTNGARAGYFIEKMTGTELDDHSRNLFGSVDHSNMLSGAELKLISEWLDLGAQNFNDPFDPAAPQN